MPSSADKPVDLGTGVVAASLTSDGSWLSVGCLHPRAGFVELNGLPPFAEAARGDPDATRRYRGLLVDPRFAFLRLVPPAERQALDSIASAEAGSRTILQRWRLGDGIDRVLRATPRLDRPALAEITEVNPPPPTGAVTELAASGSRLVVRAAVLPAVATVDVDGLPDDATWVLDGDSAELRIGGDVGALTIAVTLVADRASPGRATPAPATPAPARADEDDVGLAHGAPAAWIDRLVASAARYVRSCTALELVPGERAILTDHRLLPLSWTRDAYYQALLLLVGGEPADRAIVADHLRWLWLRNKRPNGRWMRSHHGHGPPKDLVDQADQQLYPLLELADYWRATGTLPAGVDWAGEVPAVWRSIEAAIDPGVGLIGSEEDAADDPAQAPYLAANQVLLWYVALRLAQDGLTRRIGLPADRLRTTANRVRDAFGRHLVVGGRWAHAVDGRGGRVDYHDANDLPTALAPAWGFCRPDDAAWRGTVSFALSAANPGFVDGPEGGLGSLHTPGVWPLGLVQVWLIGRITGDEHMAAVALERLERASFGDAMLPEACVMEGGEIRRIRHWFAWPGAVLAALYLLDRNGDLGSIAADAPPR